MPDAHAVDVGVGQLGQQLARGRPVVGARRLDERDGPGDRRPLARRGRPRRARRRRVSTSSTADRVAQLGRQLLEQVERGLGDDRAGREDRGGAHLQQRGHVVGRDHAADHDHHVVGAEVGQRLLQRGDQRQVTGGQRVHADDVHVGVDRLLGDLLRRGEQRADVDVEAHVGEGGDDDLLAAVVAVLAHLGDQDARATTLVLGELLGRGEHLLHRLVGARLALVHTGDRTDHGLVPAVDLLQRLGDLADGGLGAGGVDGEREQVAVERPVHVAVLGRLRQRRAGCARPRRRRAPRAAARAWRAAACRRWRCRP